MSEPATTPASSLSAGQLLRQARMAQGLHIAALAAQMKVTQRKLEALEGDRHDELPDPAFVRALALGVCRQLKIDPQPVLARLPQPDAPRLEQAARGLDTPFRDRPGREPDDDRTLLEQPVVWGPLLILLAALLMYAAPSAWFERGGADAPAPAQPSAVVTVPAPAASAAVVESSPTTAAASPTAQLAPPVATSASAPSTAAVEVETVHSAPPAPAGAEAAASAPTASPLVLRTTADAWIEVTDARGRTLLSRTVQAGETLGLDGATPLRLRIGNAAATRVSYRGEAIDLTRVTRDNVARLELK